MITRTFSTSYYCGDPEDLYLDSLIFKFTIDKIEKISRGDRSNYLVTITGEEGFVDAFFIVYDVQYEGEYD